MLRSDAIRQIAASSSAGMLQALPDARLREVYLLSDKVADAEMRLGGVVATLHALEQVCASSALMPLLVSGFSALGDQCGDDFFIDFIRHINGGQRTGAR